jgi:HK97 family phage major capsid protein
MATTKRSDLIIPELLQDAIQAEFAGRTILAGSAAAVINSTLPKGAKGGETITVPYFNSLGEMEDMPNEGDALTPVKLTMSSEESTVRHSGKAVELTHWAQLAASYADPYGESARQFRIMVERRVDLALLDQAVAALPSDYIYDHSGVGDGKITYDAMVDAQTKWGDELENIVFMAVHSKVYGDLRKLKTLDGVPLLTSATASDVTRFAGVPIRVSDKNTVIPGSPNKYISLLFKANSVVFWYNDVPRVLTDQDILADTDVLAIHMYYVTHRYLRQPGSTKPGVVKLITH